MIKITKEEIKTYNKVKQAFQQQEVLDIIQAKITELKNEQQDIQAKQEETKEVKTLKAIYDYIKNIENSETMNKYAKVLETPYWDSDTIEAAIDEIVEEFKYAEEI